MRLSTLAALLLAGLPMVGLVGTAPAFAQVLGEAVAAEPAAEETELSAEDLRTPIRVIQRRSLLRGGRLGLQFSGGGAMTDTMFQHVVAEVGARYHLTEEWSVGLTYDHHWASLSGLFQEVTQDYELFPELAMIRWLASLDAGWTAAYGKFALFDDVIMHFDLSALAGVTVLQSARVADLKPALLLGVGARLYLTRWLAVVAELRNHTYSEQFHVGARVMNHALLQAGVQIFVPFGFEYRFPR